MMNAEEASKSKVIHPLQYVKGVGPRRAEVLASEGINTPMDALEYVPATYIDRSSVGTLQTLGQRLRGRKLSQYSSRDGIDALQAEVTVVGMFQGVEERRFGKGRTMLLATLVDESRASADIIFWNYVDYYRKTIKVNQLVAVSGKPELSRFGRISFSHPEIELIEDDDVELYRQGRILPKYRISQAMKNAGLGMRQMRLMIEQIAEREQVNIHETLPDRILAQRNLPSKSSALTTMHFPASWQELDRARYRMKFEELLYFELLLALRHQGMEVRELAPEIRPPSSRARRLLDTLPFQLTAAQKRVVNEIVRDMGNAKAMNRLLQGDVGSGKTIVAILSMLMAVDNGHQALIIAPTELLAEQHYHTIKRLCDGLDIEIAQLVGGQKKKLREEVLAKIESGAAHIVVGTHALFGGSSKKTTKEITIKYHRVGLIVIDEQHRFGVEQRARLRQAGVQSYPESEPRTPHMLVMSATPIPRTLSMTAFGDLDTSIIDERPPNRRSINTKVVFESALPTHYDFIRSELSKGRQAYVVYPLVEESDKLELKAATIAFEELQHEVFPEYKCGLLHGQMLWYEKEDAMKAFLNREFDILVATTVIEVGIDVPNATVMLIQNAERFGLAQLHQLRGRVGRGEHQSYCLLATKDHFAFLMRKKEAEEREKLAAVVRLRTMEQTDDGFQIAEVDLKLRGPGDVLGTRQSGLPNFRFADLTTDLQIVEEAREEAFRCIQNDPHLRSPENVILRQEFLRRQQRNTSFLDTA